MSAPRFHPSTCFSSCGRRADPSRRRHRLRAGCRKSRCALGDGTRILRVMWKRVSSSGQSNDLPLNVTSTRRSAMRSASATSTDSSSLCSRIKNCSTSRPPASHQAMPIRNGYVPVPPARPVVSVSRKSHCSGSHTLSGAFGASSRRAVAFTGALGGSQPIDSENHRRSARCSPYLLARGVAPSMYASRSAPAGISGRMPRLASSSASDNSLRICAGADGAVPGAAPPSGRLSAFSLANLSVSTVPIALSVPPWFRHRTFFPFRLFLSLMAMENQGGDGGGASPPTLVNPTRVRHPENRSGSACRDDDGRQK